MLAKAVTAHCRTVGDDVAALARADLDITDRGSVFRTIRALRPQFVINCAAYTDVDGAESNESAAYSANSEGVENLALACRSVEAGFITISTDYVFNGEDPGFYTQRHTPDPQGVYARSKFLGEQKARNAYARSIIVRSGWIFGPGGRNFLSAMPKILAAETPIKAISDSFGTPTYALDLAVRLRELATLDLPAIFHVTNSGEGASFLKFAQKVCDICGFDDGLIEAVSMNGLKRPAPRPRSSKLACLFSEKLGLEPLPQWEAALERYIVKSESLTSAN
jgi:dTDP-4-dehydrorhamnose reductase